VLTKGRIDKVRPLAFLAAAPPARVLAANPPFGAAKTP